MSLSVKVPNEINILKRSINLYILIHFIYIYLCQDHNRLKYIYEEDIRVIKIVIYHLWVYSQQNITNVKSLIMLAIIKLSCHHYLIRRHEKGSNLEQR